MIKCRATNSDGENGKITVDNERQTVILKILDII